MLEPLGRPTPAHHEPLGPSPWVVRFAPSIPPGGQVLDLACGGGRHTRLLLSLGHRVLAVDRDLSGISDLDDERLERIETDLEDGGALPFLERRLTGVVVTNYLHRPLLDRLVAAVAPDGLLIYETFAVGHERFGPPTNPDFLLQPGELLRLTRGRLHVLAFEDVVVDEPRPAAVQRIAAVRRIR
jgi:SAM-dependent methyltransferase